MIKKDNLKIKKKYFEKIKILENYNNSYYDKSKPIVDDAIYDGLKNEILQLEKTYSFCKVNIKIVIN